MNARFVFNNCTVQIHVHQGVKEKIEVVAQQAETPKVARPTQFLLEDAVVIPARITHNNQRDSFG